MIVKKIQGYYREGVALQCLGRHAEALAAFSSGLAQVQTIPFEMVKFEDCNDADHDDDVKKISPLRGDFMAASTSPASS